MSNFTVKDITKTAIMASIVFLATYVIKIPGVNGYTHLGDCMILIGVLVLGGKKGAIAGGIGAALADFIGGYMQWVFPTLIIKFLMAIVMGLFIEKILPNFKLNWLFGAIAGGIVQIIGYTAVKIIYYGFTQAIIMTPGLIVQTVAGIIITSVFVVILGTSGIINKVKSM